ncbi:MAG: Rab family GTPase [Candidatus Hodarchaeota archaeon]
MPKKKAKGINFASFKLVLLGEFEVDKTSLFKEHVEDFFEEGYQISLGMDFLTKNIFLRDPKTDRDWEIHFQIWDIAGQSSFTNFRPLYLKNTHGAFLVFDFSHPETYTKLDSWFDDLLEQSPTAKIIVIGNNEDKALDFSITEEEIIERFHTDDFFALSSKTGERIEDAFLRMGQLIMDEPFLQKTAQSRYKPRSASQIIRHSFPSYEIKELRGIKQPFLIEGENLLIIPRMKKTAIFPTLKTRVFAPFILFDSRGVNFIHQESGQAQEFNWGMIGNILLQDQNVQKKSKLPNIVISSSTEASINETLATISMNDYINNKLKFRLLWHEIQRISAHFIRELYGINTSYENLQEI